MTFRHLTILNETFIGKLHYEECTLSTQTLMTELLARSDDIRFPLLVLTSEQTAGRGRGSNQWWSAAGSLTFSLALDVTDWNIPPERLAQITLVAGVAICEALPEFAPAIHPTLKWPNDVMVTSAANSPRKICGILTTTEKTPTHRDCVVLGIGLNVNNSLQEAPAEIQTRATSLVDLTQQEQDLTNVLCRVLQTLESCLKRFQQQDHTLAETWQQLSFLEGRTVQLQLPQETVTGYCVGVNQHGELVLQTAAGQQTFNSGMIVDYTE